MTADPINTEPARSDNTAFDKKYVELLEDALDNFLGSRTKEAVMQFLAVENDFFYLVNTVPDVNSQARPVSQMTVERIEKKLRMIFGVGGAAPILDYVNRQLSARKVFP